jgi:hypothetical protein
VTCVHIIHQEKNKHSQNASDTVKKKIARGIHQVMNLESNERIQTEFKKFPADTNAINRRERKQENERGTQFRFSGLCVFEIPKPQRGGTDPNSSKCVHNHIKPPKLPIPVKLVRIKIQHGDGGYENKKKK